MLVAQAVSPGRFRLRQAAFGVDLGVIFEEK
jgi:hypothetical protein